MTTTRTPPAPSTVRQSLVLLGGLAFALVVGELGMRRYCHAPRVLDADLGFVVDKGATTHWSNEGHGEGHFAARGVRGTWDQARFPNPILVTGDSMTEALEVNDDEVFTAVAERALSESHAISRAVVNVGVQGQRTPYYVALAPAYRRRFAPSWTVVALNDDDLTEDMFAQTGTYFSGGRDGEPLTLHELPAEGGSRTRQLYRSVRSRSALVQRSALQSLGLAAEARNTHFFRMDERQPPLVDKRAADYPVEAALDLVCTAFDNRITLLFLSAFASATPTQPTDVERSVVAYCHTHRASCVFARAAWPAFAARDAAPYGFPNSGSNKGHPNADGHHAIGVLLADELARLAAGGLL